ncbi:hypothetical protein [Larkinella rosea]|uniref:Uncharacterized protein n=1 Tax=Larkinella rosea TaxID=2025312 RepID=A0A3P1BCI5_9BACT|nr:hypothetical protein [Larkinella rosea]RRA98758.1 hypothetical protein EHT25_27585 [Larkinella rosea]
MKNKALTVLSVDLNSYKTHPPLLVISASAEMAHGGYLRAYLVPYVYITPPIDGIWDFDFVGEYPDNGVRTDVITIAIAEPFLWKDYPRGVRGIRIHGSLNKLTRLISQKSEVLFSVDGGDLPRGI